jgi:thiol:disulfide interchange protein DsbD
MKTILLSVLPLLPILLSSLAPAGPEKTIGADLQFVSDVAAIQPSVPFTVALHIHHHEGFHTYWKNPGIVGVPTSIKWTLPEGFAAGPIPWPAPEVVEMATHPAHGFHRDVLLLTEITPPAKLVADSVTLTGSLAWMACARECHPGFATRTITLAVNQAAQATPNPAWTDKIAQERRNLPAPSNAWRATIESKRGESPIRLQIKPANDTAGDPGTIYFFSEDGQISSEPPQVATRQPDGTFLITAERSEWGPKDYSALPGILVASQSWTRKATLRAIRASPRYVERSWRARAHLNEAVELYLEDSD